MALASISRPEARTYDFVINKVGKPARVVIENGVKYLVAPMTMMAIRDGAGGLVMCGSKGALGYAEDDVRNNAPDWEGVPITINHPYSAIGEALNADDQGVWDRQGVGHVRKPVYRNGLKAEGWFIADRTKKISPETYNRLIRGIPIELSTGLHTDTEECVGNDCSFGGRQFSHYARHAGADHVAILPDSVGACSLNDSCGVLVNQSGGSCDKES